MKRALLVFSLAVTLAGVSTLGNADLNSFIRSVNSQALSDINKFNQRLSNQFGIPVPDVEAIAKIVPDPADAFMILQLSQMAHVPPDVVLVKYQRNKGRGWGDLAHELGIKPGSPEFHALKRGDLSFTGERKKDGSKHGKNSRGSDEGEGGEGHGHGKDKGKGRGRD